MEKLNLIIKIALLAISILLTYKQAGKIVNQPSYNALGGPTKKYKEAKKYALITLMLTALPTTGYVLYYVFTKGDYNLLLNLLIILPPTAVLLFCELVDSGMKPMELKYALPILIILAKVTDSLNTYRTVNILMMAGYIFVIIFLLKSIEFTKLLMNFENNPIQLVVTFTVCLIAIPLNGTSVISGFGIPFQILAYSVVAYIPIFIIRYIIKHFVIRKYTIYGGGSHNYMSTLTPYAVAIFMAGMYVLTVIITI